MLKRKEHVAGIQTNPKFKIVSAILAFFVWGGWAFYANGAFGLTTRAISGLTQGISSFIITLVMIHVVTWIFNQISNKFLRSILPTLMTVGLTGSCLMLAHYLVGTPKIITTVTPGLVSAFLFCLFTTHKLTRITLNAAA